MACPPGCDDLIPERCARPECLRLLLQEQEARDMARIAQAQEQARRALGTLNPHQV